MGREDQAVLQGMENCKTRPLPRRAEIATGSPFAIVSRLVTAFASAVGGSGLAVVFEFASESSSSASAFNDASVISFR